jgi:hypothetical protein
MTVYRALGWILTVLITGFILSACSQRSTRNEVVTLSESRSGSIQYLYSDDENHYFLYSIPFRDSVRYVVSKMDMKLDGELTKAQHKGEDRLLPSFFESRDGKSVLVGWKSPQNNHMVRLVGSEK